MHGTNERFDFTSPLPTLAELGRVHFVAIGGSGMSGVARIMLARGVAVTGSDARDSAVLTSLRAAGARVWVGHDADHLEGAGTVVLSSAVREDNVELAAARARGIRVLHRAQALAVTMAGSRRVAVAGANGKTTTTAMLTEALQSAGLNPSFACGGELAGRGTNAAWGSGEVFVAEADESDGSFMVYRPDVAVVTNVQADHLDFYGTAERVEQAYAAFAGSLGPGGLLIACHDDEGSRALADRVRADRRPVLTYGFDEGADLRVSATRAGTGEGGLGTLSTLHDVDGRDRPLALGVPGRHNVLNACAAYLAATHGVDAPPEKVLSGLAGFAGTRRRFEVRGEVRGVVVVDDYAHNPAKVAAVVGTAAGLARARAAAVHVVFQPHLYSRTRDFADGFADGLAAADDVVLLDVYGAREEPMAGVSSELIAAPLRERPGRRRVEVGLGFEQAAAAVAARARAGDLVLTVGAGDVTAVAPLVLRSLGQR